MCGLGGSFGPGPPLVEAALSLRHRGPDDADAVRLQAPDGTPAFLSFTRLALLDLSSAGRQPMRSDDGRRVLLFNGEIYNHAALREELTGRGARFNSRSDTEVILRGLQLDGERWLGRLRGMFALACWDQEKGELVLARDGLGIKPLYFAFDGRRLVFASEVRALLDAGAVPRRFDRGALLGYLCHGSVPEPQALVAGVQSLGAGQLLRACARAGRVELDGPRRFGLAPAWPPSWLGESAQSTATHVPLGPLLRETVALHLVADVPVALLLSGGVDSTAVAALLRAARPDAEVTAFTVARADDPDELAAATETARRLRLRHQVVLPTEGALREQVPRFLAALDQPSTDGLNTFMVCGAVAAAGFKAALSGLGSDELFGGYALHRRMAWLWPLLDAAPRLPGLVGRGLLRLPAVGRSAKALALVAARGVSDAQLGAALDLRLHALFSPQEAAALLALDPAEVERRSLEPVAEYVDLGALPPGLSPRSRREVAYHGAMLLLRAGYLRRTLLRDADALSMAHGLELRVPLCDEALWQAVLARRPRPGAPPKQLLIEAADHPRVNEVAARPKRGFVLPLERWLAGPLRELAGDLLVSSGARAAGLSAPAVERLQKSFFARPSSARAHRLWALCALSDYLLRHRLEAA